MDKQAETSWGSWPKQLTSTTETTSARALLQPSLWQWWYNARLRKGIDTLGKDVELYGKAKIINQGEIVVGDHCVLLSEYQNVRLAVRKGAKLEIGKHCCINSAILAANVHIQIGDHCQLGPFVHLMDSDFHDLHDRTQAGKAAPIILGDGVRLGAHVIVLQGVTIGEGAEVLPGSVVTKDIPARALYGGVPAKEIVAEEIEGQ